MNDYSDIIYLMGAMIIFSMLSLNVSSFFRLNEQFQYQNEIQYNSIAVAQDIIEQIRWITDKNRFNESSWNCLCNEYPKTVTRVFGSSNEYSIAYEVDLEISDINISGSNTINKLVEITVTNEYLPESHFVKMEYIKSFIN